jgi:dTDP-4-dehydrorhamnose 3,5-epimerase
MLFTETNLPGAYLLDFEKREDNRGFFARAWCQREFEEHGLVPDLVQVNVSFNHQKGTLRGMHMQRPPHEETKLVRCTRGAIFDAIVDMRPESPTFLQWFGVELTADNYKMLYVPKGFAHGYQTLTDGAEVVYQVSAFYAPGAERGLRWDDPAFGIDWPLPVSVLSDKDAAAPLLTDEEIGRRATLLAGTAAGAAR